MTDSTDEEIIDILLPVQDLRRENTELRAEVERWKSAHDTCCASGQKLVDVIDELRAEVDRLTVELAHRVGWEERCLRAEAEVERLRAMLEICPACGEVSAKSLRCRSCTLSDA